MRWGLLLIAAFSGLAAPVDARAQAADEERARSLFEEGTAAAREERWPEALEAFEAADRLVENVNVRINLAAALVQNGRLLDAEALYGRLLEDEPGQLTDAQRAAVDRARSALEGRIPEIRLDVSPGRGDEEVRVDGAAVVAEEGLVVARVDPGSHEVRVTRGEEEVWTRTVEVDQARHMELRLPRQAPAPRPTSLEPNWIPIAIIAAGVVLTAFTAWPAVRLHDVQRDPEYVRLRDLMTPPDQDVCAYHAPREGGATNPQIEKLCRERQDQRVNVVVLPVVGGAVIVAGVIVGAVMGFAFEHPLPVTPALLLGPDRAVVGVRGAF